MTKKKKAKTIMINNDFIINKYVTRGPFTPDVNKLRECFVKVKTEKSARRLVVRLNREISELLEKRAVFEPKINQTAKDRWTYKEFKSHCQILEDHRILKDHWNLKKNHYYLRNYPFPRDMTVEEYEKLQRETEARYLEECKTFQNIRRHTQEAAAEWQMCTLVKSTCIIQRWWRDEVFYKPHHPVCKRWTDKVQEKLDARKTITISDQ